jgi:electron transport complex protein RnfG
MNAQGTGRALRRLVPLAGVAVAGAFIIHGTGGALAERIQGERLRAELRPVLELLPSPFNNDPLVDRARIDGLDQGMPAGVYRARLDGRPTGVVVMPVVARGYNGAVELAVGIAWDGTLTGVRVVKHAETPGLGDQIDQRNSRWAEQLSGRSLGDPPADQWAVRPDGGGFDGISGATITPRGVLRAVRGVLDRYALDRDSFYMGAAAP